MTTAVEQITNHIATIDESIASTQQSIEERAEVQRAEVARLADLGRLRAEWVDLLPPEEPDICPHRGIVLECTQCDADASGD